MLKRLVERAGIAFLSCNMIKGLIEFVIYLGLKEEEHFVGLGGKFVLAPGAAEFDAKVTDKPKTTQPDTDLYNAHKV